MPELRWQILLCTEAVLCWLSMSVLKKKVLLPMLELAKISYPNLRILNAASLPCFSASVF